VEFIPRRTCSGAGLGNQIERDFGRKNQLAVLFLIKLKVKENFFIKIAH